MLKKITLFFGIFCISLTANALIVKNSMNERVHFITFEKCNGVATILNAHQEEEFSPGCSAKMQWLQVQNNPNTQRTDCLRFNAPKNLSSNKCLVELKDNFTCANNLGTPDCPAN